MSENTTAQRTVAVIGCGGRGRAHAEGWQQDTRSQLVACADPVEASRDDFCEHVGDMRRYDDYAEMLKAESPDIVSICTWTGMHREMIEAAAAAGVTAIHSEKPMAPPWGDAQAIHKVCQATGGGLTFRPQRRSGHPLPTATDLGRNGPHPQTS